MKNKLIYSIILFLTFIIIFTSFCFAADDNTIMQNATNNIRNAVDGAENMVEDAAKGISNTSKDATRNLENGANTMVNNLTNNDNNTTNNTDNNQTMGITNNNDSNYNATRTATNPTTNNTFLGMNTTAWIWIILAILGVTIITLVYYLSMQNTHYNYKDDE